jgi:hypothetical protein
MQSLDFVTDFAVLPIEISALRLQPRITVTRPISLRVYNTKLHPSCELKWTFLLRDANFRSTSQLGATSCKSILSRISSTAKTSRVSLAPNPVALSFLSRRRTFIAVHRHADIALAKGLEEVDRDGAETEVTGATLTYLFRIGPANSLTAAIGRRPHVDSVEALFV